MLAAGCSSSATDAELDAAAATAVPAASVEERCQRGAEEVVDRLEVFIDSFGDASPEEFLGQQDVQGLSSFQDDVAEIIARTVNQSSTLCDLDGLQVFLDTELENIESEGLLSDYLVSSIRQGGNREIADVAIGPEDDFESVLELLASGSTITLAAGEYRFEESILFQDDIVIVGAGVDETIISSAASDAALAVFGQGKLTLRDLTVEHVGEAEASVVLAFGAAIDVEQVRIRGAVSSEETSGGNGILLSTGTVNEDGVTADADSDTPPAPTSRIVNSEISDNDIAGITVLGDLEPVIASNRIADNLLCGLCYLGEAAGVADQNTVTGNEFGIQIGDTARPAITANTVRENAVAGIVVLGTAAPQISSNTVEENGDVGIAIQEAAVPVVSVNTVSGQTIGFTVVGASTPQLSGNIMGASEVAIQVAESSNPVITANTISGATGIGIVVRDQATGRYIDTVIDGPQAVAMLVEGEAKPDISNLSATGSDVGVSYREQGAGTLENSTFRDPSIAVQIEDEGAPTVTNSTIERPEAAGFVISSRGDIEVRGNTIIEPVSLGIGIAGESNALVVDNKIDGGETAISFVDEAGGEIRDNEMTGQVVAVQVGDMAAPTLVRNRIIDSQGAAIVFRDEATGEAVENSIVNPVSVGIQVVDSAAPTVVLNAILTGFVDPDAALAEAAENAADSEAATDTETDPSEVVETDLEIDPDAAVSTDPGDTSTVGILFAGTAGGDASMNQVLGFVIGLQVSESAAPKLTENIIDGGSELGVGILYRDDSAGEANANTTANHSIGVQISDRAAPSVTNNTVEQASDVGFLLQGTVTPTLAGNTCPAAIPGIGLLEQSDPDLGENACQVVRG